MDGNRGDLHDEEEKTTGNRDSHYNSGFSTTTASLDCASGIIDIYDTEPGDASVRDSWQTFYIPASTPPLDDKIGSAGYRLARWTVFTTYRRLFTFCFAANAVTMTILGSTRHLCTEHASSAAALNLLIAILARQEHVVNTMFQISSAVPVTWPLWFRRWVAKIYCYGGWHSGCSVAASIWYAIFTGYATRDYIDGSTDLLASVVLAYLLVVVLLLIIIFAQPTVRMMYHNHFEVTHRFLGYTAVGVFWAQVMLLANLAKTPKRPIGYQLAHTPTFWCLILVTSCIIYPWLRLRKRIVRFQYLSQHAVQLHFTHATLDYCLGVRLTTNPLFETHSFATIPYKDGHQGFSVIVSNAGDWTSRLIASAKPDDAIAPAAIAREAAIGSDLPSFVDPPANRQARATQAGQDLVGKIYIKGAPIYGVLRMASIFRKPVIVTTGSGIGPCMSLLNGRPHHGVVWSCRVLWATKSPVKTYGQELVDDVRRADPNARIVDTGLEGRPDMIQLAWSLYKDEKDYRSSWATNTKFSQQDGNESPEAVIVISNPRVTRKVVYGLESRGVPAYGVIFDS